MIASPASGLRIYRKLDTKLTTDAFKSYINEKEGGSFDFVEADRIRDYIWTDEIVGATVGYSVVGSGGDTLADFKTLAEAEAAKASAKVVFNVELADDEDED